MRLNRVYIIFIMCALIFYPAGYAVAQQLTAGDVDDNLNFEYFNDYVTGEQAGRNSHILPSYNFTDRVVLKIVNNSGRGVSSAFVQITPEGANKPLVENHAGTNGIFYFFPKIDGVKTSKKFKIDISSPVKEWTQTNISLDLDKLDKNRTMKIVVREFDNNLPTQLDLMFVIDTTGSMHDELRYLTAEFKGIIENVTDGYPNVSIRFGLVVYRDIGDQYVVKNYKFTDSLEIMQKQLTDQKASGGGDYPEAMDQALAKAVNYQWRGGNTARLLFLVADAPPHDDKLQATMNEVIKARENGIHIYSLAASGVADTAEYIMRCSSVLTHGRYMFLTDDSGIGNTHIEPHIKGYAVTYLDDLFVRVVGSELAGERIEPTEDEIVRTVGNVTDGIIGPYEPVNSTDCNGSGSYGSGGSGGGSGSGSGSGGGCGSGSGSSDGSGGSGEGVSESGVEVDYSDESEVIVDVVEDDPVEDIKTEIDEDETEDDTDHSEGSGDEWYKETTITPKSENSVVDNHDNPDVDADANMLPVDESAEPNDDRIDPLLVSDEPEDETWGAVISPEPDIGESADENSQQVFEMPLDESNTASSSIGSSDAPSPADSWLYIAGVIALYVVAGVALVIYRKHKQ